MIEQLTDFLVKTHHLGSERRQDILDTVLEREKQISTGVGEELAIPHGTMEMEDNILGVIGICKNGVDFNSPDDKPVKIVILIVTPKNHYDKHLEVLATVARMFGSNPQLRNQIIDARSAAEVYEILTQEEVDLHNYFLEDD
ncbi:MAG: PTS sugar transporter subunit IIA [Spirochaetes bacterium]|nr:PTS sugar transporter subunit IIA [Spirochaetota bacterium]